MKKSPGNPTEESFLSRWSRRKTETADQAEAETVLDTRSDPASAGELAERPGGEAAPEKILTDADMPDVDTLDENSDYSPFLGEGVSEKLRKLALRKLFRNPALNIRDGLDDYDDDFTHFPALGDLVTSDMKHQQEMREKRRLEREAEEAEQAEQAQREQVMAEAENESEHEAEEPDAPEPDSQQAMTDENATEENVAAGEAADETDEPETRPPEKTT